MEVFRYWTASKFEKARVKGVLESNHPDTFPRYPRHIFVLPESPLAWGVEETRNKLLLGVRYLHGFEPSDEFVLFNFQIEENDPNIFIRDLYGEDEFAWYPIATHKPQMFQYPEMIVPTPIPMERVRQLPMPLELSGLQIGS